MRLGCYTLVGKDISYWMGSRHKSTWWCHQMQTFLCYWPFVWGIQWSPVNSQHKGQLHGALMFSLICASINGYNNKCHCNDDFHYFCPTVHINNYVNISCFVVLCCFGCKSTYRLVSNIRRTLIGNWIVDHSDVVGASPVGAALKFWDLVRLILETLRYPYFSWLLHHYRGSDSVNNAPVPVNQPWITLYG